MHGGEDERSELEEGRGAGMDGRAAGGTRDLCYFSPPAEHAPVLLTMSL